MLLACWTSHWASLCRFFLIQTTYFLTPLLHNICDKEIREQEFRACRAKTKIQLEQSPPVPSKDGMSRRRRGTECGNARLLIGWISTRTLRQQYVEKQLLEKDEKASHPKSKTRLVKNQKKMDLCLVEANKRIFFGAIGSQCIAPMVWLSLPPPAAVPHTSQPSGDVLRLFGVFPLGVFLGNN